METLKSILLVEDDKDDQFFFIRALREIENVTLYDIANNGIEALDKLEKSNVMPALIFMDIDMPLMNGIDCLTEIAKKPEMKNIPIVMLSTSIGQLELARKLGAKAFIEKPNSVKELQAKIEQMISFNFIEGSYMTDQTFQT